MRYPSGDTQVTPRTPRGFVARMLAYYSSRDLVPLYSVYSMLFRDHGLSLGQISSLFILWSLTSFAFEVPSGAWADTVDRRRLLVLSAGMYAAAFSVWMLLPTYTGFATGFVLWGLSSAMMSGTFESLLYDELAARRAEDDYPSLVGWCHSAAMASNLLASAAAAPLLAWGGYALVGWSSVVIAGVQAMLAATLPVGPVLRRGETRQRAAVTVGAVGHYVSMLSAGLHEAASAVAVRRTLLISSALVGFTAYDEYFGLLAGEHGVATDAVPWLVGLTVAGQLVGAALVGRTAGIAPATMSRWVAAGAGLMSVGALVVPTVGFVAIACGYGVLNNMMLVSEARLQQVIRGPARATVTSVAGLGTEVGALLVYGGFAFASPLLSVSVLVALVGVPLVVVAGAVRWWLPAAGADVDDGQ